MKNKERALSRLIREIAQKKGYSIAEFSDEWLYCLSRNGQSRYVIGYDFDLNPAAAHLISKDKSATSDLLHHHGIPRVEHVLFHHPQMASYVPFTGNWTKLTQYAQRHNFDVVCKPNQGTGGADVCRVRSQPELELAIQELFEKTRAVALSPFYEIEQEFRVIVLDGEVQLAYVKVRPSVIGDGTTPMFELVSRYIAEHGRSAAGGRLLGHLADAVGDLNVIPPAGAVCHLNWRHNLGQGSSLRVLSTGELRELGLGHLALRAAAALNIRFASVDIVETEGAFLVLEINSGIMMESFISLCDDGYERARAIYERAVDAMFASPS